MKKKTTKLSIFRRLWLFLAVLGPGLITASADNDAPGIATYSRVGSYYGYKFLWIILLITVGEVIIQEMAARLGAVTGKGTADLIREKFGVKITFFAMISLLIANLGTTIAQFAGIASGGELLGISRFILVPLVALLIGFFVLRGTYKNVEKFLLIMSLSSLSYIVTVFMLKPDFGEILRNAITPTFEADTNYILAVLATVGTTITPWGFFYMQSSVVDKGVEIDDYPLTKADVIFGATWGNLVSAFIIISTGATLFISGIRVESSEEAALVLAPLAGEWAGLLFTAGLMGASILAAIVLPLSTVYAISEAFGWERGLDQRKDDAPFFYWLYIGIIVFSALFVLIPGLPLFRIMWLSQTVNAIFLPVLLILALKLVNDIDLMGQYRNKRAQNYFTIGLTIFITLVAAALFVMTMNSG
ncbi:MAG: Nramp family divalent metal transporter [Pelolinea sp.]|nr:Nramp family divalent metal transporter [Pelolinea sp.]